jgi:hypothetical protein
MRTVLPVVLVVLLLAPATARADGLITPYVGYDFGGNAGSCGNVPGCKTKQVTWGGGLGFMVGGVLGIEADFSYAPHFFGESSQRSDNYVLTVMGNLIAGVPIGPIRPYAVGGVGLLRTDISRSPSGLYNALTDNSVAFDIGGGMMGFFSNHVGLRGDIRFVRSFSTLSFSAFDLSDENLEFWRGVFGVTFKF